MDEIELHIRQVLKKVFGNYQEKFSKQEIDALISRINIIFQDQIEKYSIYYDEIKNQLSNNYIFNYYQYLYDFFNLYNNNNNFHSKSSFNYPFNLSFQSLLTENLYSYPHYLYQLSLPQQHQLLFNQTSEIQQPINFSNKTKRKYKTRKTKSDNRNKKNPKKLDNKSISIDSFNKLSIQSQQTVISQINEISRSPILSSIKTLLLFLKKFFTDSDERLFTIFSQDDHFRIDQIESNLKYIQISSTCTTLLTGKRILNEFGNIIKEVLLPVRFSIQYPSSTFSEEYDEIMRIKRQSSANISICIFIIDSTFLEYRFSGNNGIDELIFCDSNKCEIIGNQQQVISNNRGPFSGCLTLTKVTFSSSVKEIGYSVFNGCHSLKEVNFGNKLKKIGNHCFAHCTSLTTINIPSTVTCIERSAFNGCSSLSSISIPSSINELSEYLFNNCSSLSSIHIPTSVTKICDHCFAHCTSLTTIEIPGTVTCIERSAFNECSSLSSISIPSSINELSDYLFNNCSSLSLIFIPTSVTKIGDHCFAHCTSLTTIEIPDSIVYIEKSAFNGCTSLSSVRIPNSVQRIGDFVFNCCESLTSVSIPNSVISIGHHCFAHCTSLTQITLPSSFNSVPRSTFNGCTSLKTVSIPETVVNIGEYAFKDCSSLTHLDLPHSVSLIGPSALIGCTSLLRLTVPRGVSISSSGISSSTEIEMKD